MLRYGLDETIRSFSESTQRCATAVAPDAPEPHSISYTDYDDALSFVGQTTKEAHVIRFSQLSWVDCGDNIYVLECLGKGFIRVSHFEDPKGNGGHVYQDDFILIVVTYHR